MKMRSMYLFVLLLTSLVSDHICVLADHPPIPAVRLMVTKKGLDYLNIVGVKLLKQIAVSRLESQVFNGSIMKYSLHANYAVYNINVAYFDVKNSSIYSSPNNGLNIRMDNISLEISANFRWSVGHLLFGFALFSDKGSIVVSTTGLTLHLGVFIKSGKGGQPLINVTTCSFTVGDLKLGGNLSPFYVSPIKAYIADKLGSKNICKLVERSLEDLVKKTIPSPPVIWIDDKSGISYALVKPPNFTSQYIVTHHKGDFLSAVQPNIKAPFSHLPLPQLLPGCCGNKMVYMWVTDYVANMAIMVYKRAGILTYTITPTSLDGDKKSFFKLDTSTFSLIIPQLYHRFHERNLTLVIRAAGNKLPVMNFTENGVDLFLPAALDVYVNEENGKMPLAFSLGVTANITATISLDNSSDNNSFALIGNATCVTIDVTPSLSNIGPIEANPTLARSSFAEEDCTGIYAYQECFALGKRCAPGWISLLQITKINNLIKGLNLINETVLPGINKFANKGINIPKVDGLTFVSPELKFYMGCILLETNIEYEMTSSHTEKKPDGCKLANTSQNSI